MKLAELLENNASSAIGGAEITSITDDTRKVKPGSLFVCIKGGSFDGHDAAAAGAGPIHAPGGGRRLFLPARGEGNG